MDNDGFINMTDLYNTLRCLTREELTKEEINLVVQKVKDSPRPEIEPGPPG